MSIDSMLHMDYLDDDSSITIEDLDRAIEYMKNPPKNTDIEATCVDFIVHNLWDAGKCSVGEHVQGELVGDKYEILVGGIRMRICTPLLIHICSIFSIDYTQLMKGAKLDG